MCPSFGCSKLVNIGEGSAVLQKSLTHVLRLGSGISQRSSSCSAATGNAERMNPKKKIVPFRHFDALFLPRPRFFTDVNRCERSIDDSVTRPDDVDSLLVKREEPCDGVLHCFSPVGH